MSHTLRGDEDVELQLEDIVYVADGSEHQARPAIIVAFLPGGGVRVKFDDGRRETYDVGWYKDVQPTGKSARGRADG